MEKGEEKKNLDGSTADWMKIKLTRIKDYQVKSHTEDPTLLIYSPYLIWCCKNALCNMNISQ